MMRLDTPASLQHSEMENISVGDGLITMVVVVNRKIVGSMMVSIWDILAIETEDIEAMAEIVGKQGMGRMVVDEAAMIKYIT